MRCSVGANDGCRRGVTLIEVVCATLIAATLLASTLVASGRQAKQASGAAAKRKACDLLDELLTSRELGSVELRVGEETTVPDRPDWRYLVTRRSADEVWGMRLSVERIAVWTVATEAGREASAAVELLVPAETHR